MQRSDKYYQVPKHLNFKHLSNEEIGAIFRALNEYDGERAELGSPLLNYVYESICDHIDEENERYEEFCNTKRINASKKAKASGSKLQQANASGSKLMQANDPTNQNKTNTNTNQINNTTTTATTTCEREAVIDDKTHNAQDIRRSLIGWLRKGKTFIDTKQHKNMNAKLHNNADRPANGASGRTRNGTGGSLDFIDQRCREIGL